MHPSLESVNADEEEKCAQQTARCPQTECGGLLGGLVAHEIAMRLAVVDVNVGQHLVAAVNLTVVSHKRGQPPRRAGDAILLNLQPGMLRCGRAERGAASKALGRVIRHADSLLKRVR